MLISYQDKVDTSRSDRPARSGPVRLDIVSKPDSPPNPCSSSGSETQ